MWQIGVWERDEGLAERVSRLAEGCSALVRACGHPAQGNIYFSNSSVSPLF